MATIEKLPITSEAQALKMIKSNPNCFEKIPVKFMTKKVCDEAFKANPYSRTYAYIPEKHRTFAMCLQAAPDYGSETKDFAECQLQPEWGISVSAFVKLKKKGELPHFKKNTPQDVIEICYKKAFAENALTLLSMPKDLIPKIVNKANVNSALHCTESSGRFSSTMYFKGCDLVGLIPKNLMTEGKIEYFQEKVKEYLENRHVNINVSKIPEEYMTNELYELAISKSASALSYVPEDRITKKMCEISVSKDGRMIDSVPEKWRGDFYVNSVKSGQGLHKIPEEDRTDRLCALAVETSADQYEYVPQDKKSYALSLQAIDNNAQMIEFVPEDQIDEEMVIRLIISIFRENWEHDFCLVDLPDYRKEKGQKEAVLMRVFNHFFQHPHGDYKRKEELRDIMHKVLERDGKLYFALMNFSGENDKNDGFSRFNSGRWKDYFEGSVKFDHAVTAARQNIEIVSGFKQDVQAKVWKEFLENNK